MKVIISIIGFGNIGKAICTQLLPKKDASFVINVVDPDTDIEGAVLDFQHGLQLFPNHTIAINSQALLNESDFIFHCAGASVPKGESRLITCQESIAITETIFNGFKPLKKPFIIVVSNPVEIIASVTQKITGLPPEQVVGTGTFLDSIRMDYLIKTQIPEAQFTKSVLLGEHGAFVYMSRQLSQINGVAATEIISDDQINYLMDEVIRSAGKIKATQEATIYGVSYCAMHIFDALQSSKNGLIPLSTHVPDWLRKEIKMSDFFLSLYAKVDQNGITADENYVPNSDELAYLKKAADQLQLYIPNKYL